MIELIIKQEYGWNHYVIGEYDLWFKGYIFNGNVKSFLMHGMQLLQNDAVKNSEIEGWLTKTQGHFSFVIASNESLLCGVDHVRSIPLFYSINGVEIKIGVYAPSISKSIDFVEMDKQAALEILMSGYTVGKKRLFSA